MWFNRPHQHSATARKGDGMAKRKFTKKQSEWCKFYQRQTSFEPLMDDYLAGNESFAQAAAGSIEWFSDYANETRRNLERALAA